MSDLKVGIVIPNHNYGRWISDAVQSVLRSSYKDVVLAIVDDGSTDNSLEVLSSLCKTELKDGVNKVSIEGVPAYIYRFAQAGGPSRARNTGIKILWQHVQMFGFLDADDMYMPEKISLSVNKIKEDPMHIGAIYTDYDTVDELGIIRREYKEPFSRERLMKDCILYSACIVNRQALAVCGTFDEEMRVAEDYDLWLRVSERFVIVHIPESLMLLRVGKYNSTNTIPMEVWRAAWKRCGDKMKERMKNG
jgi:glycosyltransferase involved in cell wall biosynthesis